MVIFLNKHAINKIADVSTVEITLQNTITSAAKGSIIHKTKLLNSYIAIFKSTDNTQKTAILGIVSNGFTFNRTITAIRVHVITRNAVGKDSIKPLIKSGRIGITAPIIATYTHVKKTKIKLVIKAFIYFFISHPYAHYTGS